MPTPKEIYQKFSEQVRLDNRKNTFFTNLVSELTKGVKDPKDHKYTEKDIKLLNDHIKKMAAKFQKNTNHLDDNQIKSFQEMINNLVALQGSINEKLKFKSFIEPRKRSVVERFGSIFHRKQDTKPTLQFNPEESPKPRKK